MAQRVLITGAAGTIGRALREGLSERYELLRLLDVSPQAPARAGEEIVTADVCDAPALAEAMTGIDAVVHLAAIPTDAPFEPILDANVVGTYRVFEAARRSGVGRVVFASSHHVTGFYPRTEWVTPAHQVRPDSYYAVSKVFGEALGRLYADKHGLEVACLRISAWRERPDEVRHLGAWLSERDGVDLVARCLDAPRLGFVVVYGVSANTRAWVGNDGVESLGWEPQDDAERFAAAIEVLPPALEPGSLADRLHGGPYVSRDFDPDFR